MTDIPEKQIRATYTPETIRVYQAYSEDIAESALRHQTFVSPPFSMTRMTWIKPSFRWMMYRAGWGKKDTGQVKILAIDITHDGFAWALENSCGSHPDPSMTREEWSAFKDRTPVRIQWDPERDLYHAPLPHRAIQIGLKEEAVRRYTDEWIKSVTNVTPLAHEIHNLVLAEDLNAAKSRLPLETPYEPRQKP